MVVNMAVKSRRPLPRPTRWSGSVTLRTRETSTPTGMPLDLDRVPLAALDFSKHNALAAVPRLAPWHIVELDPGRPPGPVMVWTFLQ